MSPDSGSRDGMKKWIGGNQAAMMALAAVMAMPAETEAILTDDGGIAGVGEMEVWLWAEMIPGGGSGVVVAPFFNGEVALTPFRGLEMTLGGGAGIEMEGGWTVMNPFFQLKTLLLSPQGFLPGIAWSAGVLPAWGMGEAFEDATTLYTMGAATIEMPGEWVVVHANAGWVSAIDGGFRIGRPFLGLGAEWALGESSLTLLTEFFAGEPGDAGAGGPAGFVDGPFATQLGLGWEAREDLFVHGGVIADLEFDWYGHLGVVFYFDTPLRAGAVEDPALFEWGSEQ